MRESKFVLQIWFWMFFSITVPRIWSGTRFVSPIAAERERISKKPKKYVRVNLITFRIALVLLRSTEN